MKTLSKVTVAIMVAGASAAGGCVTSETEEVAAEDAEATGTTESASSYCREVKNFSYTRNGARYTWDVTTQLWDGRQFVDERRAGDPSTHRQFRVYPRWSNCPLPGGIAYEIVRLTNPSIVLEGRHNCLSGGYEEFHGPDYQRVLAPESPFITYNCDL